MTTNTAQAPTIDICQYCGEEADGTPREWSDHRGTHRPHCCFTCHEYEDEREREEEERREEAAYEARKQKERESLMTEHDRKMHALEMRGEW